VVAFPVSVTVTLGEYIEALPVIGVAKQVNVGFEVAQLNPKGKPADVNTYPPNPCEAVNTNDVQFPPEPEQPPPEP
jgi:hypothetical protein